MMDDARLFRRTDPDFPTIRAVQQRLVDAGRVDGEGPPGVLTQLARELGQPFRAVATCGGHRTVQVASSRLADVRAMRQLAAGAPVTSAKPEVCAVINGPVGRMRATLRIWLKQW